MRLQRSTGFDGNGERAVGHGRGVIDADQSSRLTTLLRAPTLPGTTTGPDRTRANPETNPTE
jgi:hypothetical protein